MVLLILVPLFLGGVAAAFIKSASEVLSEESTEGHTLTSPFSERFEFDYSEEPTFNFHGIEGLDRGTVSEAFDYGISDQLLEIVEKHERRIRRLEKMLDIFDRNVEL